MAVSGAAEQTPLGKMSKVPLYRCRQTGEIPESFCEPTSGVKIGDTGGEFPGHTIRRSGRLT
jgi:hypothetical protein